MRVSEECFQESNAPGLPADPDEDENLNREVDDCLTDNASQDLLGDQTGSRSLGVDLGVWQSTSHYDRSRQLVRFGEAYGSTH